MTVFTVKSTIVNYRCPKTLYPRHNKIKWNSYTRVLWFTIIIAFAVKVRLIISSRFQYVTAGMVSITLLTISQSEATFDETYHLSLQWRHNGRDSVSNHQPHHCLLNGLFRRRSKKTSKLRVTGHLCGEFTGPGEFPAQMASNAENVSI